MSSLRLGDRELQTGGNRVSANDRWEEHEMALPADRKFGKFSELCYTLPKFQTGDIQFWMKTPFSQVGGSSWSRIRCVETCWQQAPPL